MSIKPKPEEQSSLKFYFEKSLPYSARIILIACFLLGGLLIQLLIHVWIGLVVMFIGILLGAHRGIDAAPKLKGKETWAQVTPDEYQKIINKNNEWKRWDRDSFDITNGLGVGILIITGLFCFIGSVFIINENADYYFDIFFIDCAVILLPLWFIGIRTFMKFDDLMIKIKILKRIIYELAPMTQVQVLPMLAVKEAEEGGKVPSDARLMIRILNSPDWFMGVQIQICINNVQGTHYPYLYAVVLTKPSANKLSTGYDIARSSNANGFTPTYETNSTEEADVLIVRQKTTRQSGYYTNNSVSTAIVKNAISIAEKLCSSKI